MKKCIDNYVDLVARYALLGENGYYIDPNIIGGIVVEEAGISKSFEEIKELIKNASISLSEEEIKVFLDKKMDEEHPELREKLKNRRQITRNLAELTADDIKRDLEQFEDYQLSLRYAFFSENLQEYVTYVDNLKKKCENLLSILEDMIAAHNQTVSPAAWECFRELDFHINLSGNVYVTDVCRFVDAFVYNIRDLCKVLEEGNKLETYLSFKGGKRIPSKEVQIKSLNSLGSEFIQLSDEQKAALIDRRKKSLSLIISEDFMSE